MYRSISPDVPLSVSDDSQPVSIPLGISMILVAVSAELIGNGLRQMSTCLPQPELAEREKYTAPLASSTTGAYCDLPFTVGILAVDLVSQSYTFAKHAFLLQSV